MMFTRAEVVQSFLDLYDSPSYLEIGVHRGETFSEIRAKRKVAVDPVFLCEKKNEQTATSRVEFHEVTSDVYFQGAAQRYELFEVVYLDGLHTFEQTARDLFSAIALLRPQGTIIIDDTIPNTYHSGLPSQAEAMAIRSYLGQTDERWTNDLSWMGDVFKLIYFIQTFMPLYSYATVAENHGQTVIWRQARAVDPAAERTVEQVARLAFRDIVLNPEALNRQPLASIITQVRQARMSLLNMLMVKRQE